MIFFGTNGSKIHQEKKGGLKCDNCNEIVSHQFSVFGKYSYLYWIPIFPMSKKVFSECTNCKVTEDFKGMNEKLRNVSADVKRNAKTPIWYWSGLGIIAIIISIGYYSSMQHNIDVDNYIMNPKAGDVIEYKVKETKYFSSLKIDSVTRDSVFVIQNDYDIDKKSGISDIDKNKNYTTKAYGLSKGEIKSLFEKGVFYDINR